jgi:glycosyltransferase involved in cell wall biosynthesis
VKILYVIDTLNNGGAERQLSLLAKYLPAEWDRRVFSLGGGQFANVIRSNGILVDICERKARYDPRPTFILWRLLREWKPDIVHSWGWMSSVAAGFFCNVLGIPFIDGTIRMGDMPARRALSQRLGMIGAKRIIANSKAGLTAWKISSKRGRVVYNGFDPERSLLCDSINEESVSFFTVIMVAQMHPAKDYKTFFDAIRLITKKEVGWKFIALGLGVFRESLLKQAADLVNSGVLIFPEPTLEVLPYVKKANVGVLMTKKGVHKEGISNAIMEYMACGLPVVCSESGGNRELVIDEKTGFIIEPNSPDVLVEKLMWLKRHSGIAHAMGQAGKERIKLEFTVEKMVANTLAVYSEMLTT